MEANETGYTKQQDANQHSPNSHCHQNNNEEDNHLKDSMTQHNTNISSPSTNDIALHNNNNNAVNLPADQHAQANISPCKI